MHSVRKILLTLFTAAALLLTACAGDGIGRGEAAVSGTDSSAPAPGSSSAENLLKVHFIDVGQGDSILIQAGTQAMLVDAGTNESGPAVVDYLKSQNIEKLAWVIGTHPHEDHIGGLDDVLHSFEVENVILPDVSHTTRTYEDVLDALIEKDLTVTIPVPGDAYLLGELADKVLFTILSPDPSVMEAAESEDNLNNYSVGLRLIFGDTAFVMCGDAEILSEEAMLHSGLPLQADVLKLSHHGSSTSTSEAFLDAVSPSWAVVSCGKDNSYGHPHREIVDKLNSAGIGICRTDEQGTMVAVSNGASVSWSEADIAKSQTTDTNRKETAATDTYILNENTRKFHLPECSSVSQMKAENRVSYGGSREELTRQGYEPCGSCKP